MHMDKLCQSKQSHLAATYASIDGCEPVINIGYQRLLPQKSDEERRKTILPFDKHMHIYD